MRELTLPGRLILLPGLGSTSAVFDHQRKAFGDRLVTPNFIPHQPGESVAGYAQRWAKLLSKPDDDRPVFLGGVSFGGMLAQEMALHLQPRPRAVFLIASTRTGESVTGVMQLAELLGRFVPTGSVNKSLPLLKLFFALREGLDDDDKRRLMQGAREIDPAMTKWAAGASVGWSGFQPPAGYPPIHQIHSRHDWVLKAPTNWAPTNWAQTNVAPTDQPAVQWIDGNSHLLHMTHAHTVNRWLFDHILAHCPEVNIDMPDTEDPHTTAQRRLILEGAPAGTPMV